MAGVARSHLWIYMLSRISTAQFIIRMLLLLVLSFFAIKLGAWLSLVVFFGSIIVGGLLTRWLDQYNPKQSYEEYKSRLLEGQFQTKEQMKQHEHQFEISNEPWQGIDYADLFFIYVIEPLMYTGICLSVAYGFFDGIHLYNIPTQYVLLLVLGFFFLSCLFARVRHYCMKQELQDHKKLKGLWEIVLQCKGLVCRRVTSNGPKSWFTGRTYWYLCFSLVFLVGVYLLSQWLLPFQSIMNLPHIFTILAVTIVGSILFFYYASSYNEGIFRLIQCMVITVIMVFFYISFFKMAVVLFGQIPLSHVMAMPGAMLCIVSVSIGLGLYYGWYTLRLSSQDFENLRYEIEVQYKPVDANKVSQSPVNASNEKNKDGSDNLDVKTPDDKGGQHIKGDVVVSSAPCS